DGGLAPGQSIPAPNAGSLAIADVTGDGRPDVIAGESSDFIVVSANDAGAFAISSTTAAPNGWLAVGDVTGDGQADVVIAGLNATTVFANSGTGAFSQV